MAELDLSKTIIPYLDRHLAFPLLAHLVETSIFPVEEVRAAQYELAKGTNMVDYAVGLFGQLHPGEAIPAGTCLLPRNRWVCWQRWEEFSGKRERAVSTNERLQQEAQAVLDVIENPDVAQALRQDKNQNLQYLKDNYNVRLLRVLNLLVSQMSQQLTLEQITALYNFGQFQYTYGNYSGAADYLYHFRVLSTDNDLNTSAHWGKLASDILTGKWEVALEELNTLRDVIDSRSPSSLLTTSAEPAALTQLHSRTWLVHWSLFVYFNHEQGRTLLLETFLSPTYLNTIQTSCPWILRYLATAAILSRKTSASGTTATSSRVRHSIREIVKVIQTEEYQYQDPVTSFLKELYVEFDFEAAQRELTKAESVVENDFFLGEFREEFLDNARYLISEAYCRIHQRIDIGCVALNFCSHDPYLWPFIF
jgi:translation initiation factor 3 subunit E